jgi:integrase
VKIVPAQKLGHTPDHRNCPACQGKELLHELCLSPDLVFSEAFKIWINDRVIKDASGHWTKANFVSERTADDLRQYARALGKFFDRLELREISNGHLHAYQRARALNSLLVGNEERKPWEERAGANLIRREVQMLIRVLRAAGVWNEDRREALELVSPVESDVQRALSPNEQQVWMRAAASRPEWRVIYSWSVVALQTTAATNEMRSLRLGDIFLERGTMQIRTEGAKNRFRVRTIPLQTPEVNWALEELIERAGRMGSTLPMHYLFPIHVTRDRYDPLTPMTKWGLRKPWDDVQKETGLDWFTPYGLRHTAITRMAERGVPIQVIMSFAGHISPRMQQHYTAISQQAMRRWAATAFAGAEIPLLMHGSTAAALEGYEKADPPAPISRRRA